MRRIAKLVACSVLTIIVLLTNGVIAHKSVPGRDRHDARQHEVGGGGDAERHAV